MPDQTRNLNSVTDFAGTLDSNDRIIMTDNKASLKALTTAILGKAMIEGYTGSSLAGESRSVKSAIDALNSKLTIDTYNSGGLIIHRVGRTAQLAAIPTVTTTSSNAVVATIPAGAFRPASRVWMATKVYNGSNYVDCYLEMTTGGDILIKSPTGSIVAGYQANYTQILGLNFLCVGD